MTLFLKVSIAFWANVRGLLHYKTRWWCSNCWRCWIYHDILERFGDWVSWGHLFSPRACVFLAYPEWPWCRWLWWPPFLYFYRCFPDRLLSCILYRWHLWVHRSSLIFFFGGRYFRIGLGSAFEFLYNCCLIPKSKKILTAHCTCYEDIKNLQSDGTL